MEHVDYSRQGSVAVLAFQNPPVNSLSRSLRVALVAAVERAIADPAVEAMVMIGANGTFCAGADIKEFDSPAALRGPTIWNLYAMLDDSPKPAVAAIEGVALGGGLEFAMACHYRVALSTAQVGLPEVKLGLLPGAGGTQRLPRLIGVEGALNVMLSGEPLPCRCLRSRRCSTGWWTRTCCPRRSRSAKAAVAARKADPSKPLPRARDRRVKEPNLEALLQFARNTVRAAFKEYPAPLAIIDAVGAAAKLPFDAGLAEEARLFAAADGLAGVQGAAAHLLRRARRAARRRAAAEDADPRDQGRGDHRRRYDGHRHRDQLPERGHPDAPARGRPGSARSWRQRASARTTRARSGRAAWTRRSATRRSRCWRRR